MEEFELITTSLKTSNYILSLCLFLLSSTYSLGWVSIQSFQKQCWKKVCMCACDFVPFNNIINLKNNKLGQETEHNNMYNNSSPSFHLSQHLGTPVSRRKTSSAGPNKLLFPLTPVKSLFPKCHILVKIIFVSIPTKHQLLTHNNNGKPIESFPCETLYSQIISNLEWTWRQVLKIMLSGPTESLSEWKTLNSTAK